jgi:chromate transporter
MKGLSSAGEVFLVFLRLGLTSFGGTLAHLSYFREEFVVWCEQAE